jgi:hypothetical protein
MTYPWKFAALHLLVEDISAQYLDCGIGLSERATYPTVDTLA